MKQFLLQNLPLMKPLQLLKHLIGQIWSQSTHIPRARTLQIRFHTLMKSRLSQQEVLWAGLPSTSRSVATSAPALTAMLYIGFPTLWSPWVGPGERRQIHHPLSLDAAHPPIPSIHLVPLCSSHRALNTEMIAPALTGLTAVSFPVLLLADKIIQWINSSLCIFFYSAGLI